VASGDRRMSIAAMLDRVAAERTAPSAGSVVLMRPQPTTARSRRPAISSSS